MALSRHPTAHGYRRVRFLLGFVDFRLLLKILADFFARLDISVDTSFNAVNAQHKLCTVGGQLMDQLLDGTSGNCHIRHRLLCDFCKPCLTCVFTLSHSVLLVNPVFGIY